MYDDIFLDFCFGKCIDLEEVCGTFGRSDQLFPFDISVHLFASIIHYSLARYVGASFSTGMVSIYVYAVQSLRSH